MATDMHSVRKEGEYASALLRVGVLFDRTGSGHHGVRWRGYRIRGNCQDLVLFVPGVVPGEFGDAYWQTSLAGQGASDVISDFVSYPVLLAALPAWPYSRGWGYYPSGTLGTILLILVVLMLIGYIPF
jgi:hypothetical protein